MKAKIFTLAIGVIFCVAVISCANSTSSDGTSGNYENHESSENSILISVNRSSGRSAASVASRSAARTAFGANTLYQVSVTLTGENGYSETNTLEMPIGGDSTATFSFYDVPYGQVAATASVLSREHKKFSGSKSIVLDSDNVEFAIALDAGHYDYSGIATGDIVKAEGGWIARTDFTSTDSGNYIALAFDGAKYAVTGAYSEASHTNALTTLSGLTAPTNAASSVWELPSKNFILAIADSSATTGTNQYITFLLGWQKLLGWTGSSIPAGTTYTMPENTSIATKCWTSDAAKNDVSPPQYPYTSISSTNQGSDYAVDTDNKNFFGVCKLISE